MDESDSDSDSPQTKPRGGDDELNQYPVDGLFKDYEEKEQIMGMREIEREQILAERREENERIRQNRMLRQLKVNQDKDIKKRKASAADLEDGQRKASRVRTKAGETSEKMDSLRRAREERSSRKEQRERENDRRKQQSPSYRRSRSRGDEDSDVEWMGPSKSKQKSRSPDARESLPAELRDVERIRLGRSRFAEVCFYPGFEEAITGCFVRINIGPDPEKGQDVYRMAVIKGNPTGRCSSLHS
jgi:RNA polymerase-associated protein RTF1